MRSDSERGDGMRSDGVRGEGKRRQRRELLQQHQSYAQVDTYTHNKTQPLAVHETLTHL